MDTNLRSEFPANGKNTRKFSDSNLQHPRVLRLESDTEKVEIFRVKIGEPLTTGFEDKLGAIRAATAGFLAELEAAVVESPEQWRGWKYLEFAKAPS